MKKRLVAYVCVTIWMAGNLFAVEADIDGATPGKWTMDLEAAKKVAAEKKLPILLDFSGSDWCGWCTLMETNVFMKAEWTAYATNNLMMVLIDFPNDKSLVPEKYVERNQELNEKYGVEGFPTFVVLDDDGETELGRLGAGRDKTPEIFIAELKKLFSSRAAEMGKFMESLDPEQKAAFLELKTTLEHTKTLLAEQVRIMEEAKTKTQELGQSIAEAEKEIQMFRMQQQLGAEEFKVYKELQEKIDAAMKKMTDWIATNPERNDENVKLYQEMNKEIQTLQEQLSEY